LKSLFDYNQQDRKFYEDTLLKAHSKRNYQEELLAFLKSNKVSSTLDFYPFLQAFKNSQEAKDENLQFTLLETEATEKILAPLNQIFRYLQRKTIWTKEEIEADSNISA